MTPPHVNQPAAPADALPAALRERDPITAAADLELVAAALTFLDSALGEPQLRLRWGNYALAVSLDKVGLAHADTRRAARAVAHAHRLLGDHTAAAGAGRIVVDSFRHVMRSPLAMMLAPVELLEAHLELAVSLHDAGSCGDAVREIDRALQLWLTSTADDTPTGMHILAAYHGMLHHCARHDEADQIRYTATMYLPAGQRPGTPSFAVAEFARTGTPEQHADVCGRRHDPTAGTLIAASAVHAPPDEQGPLRIALAPEVDRTVWQELARRFAGLDPHTLAPTPQIVAAAFAFSRNGHTPAAEQLAWGGWAYQGFVDLFGWHDPQTLTASAFYQTVLSDHHRLGEAIALCRTRLQVTRELGQPTTIDRARLANLLHRDGQCAAARKEITALSRKTRHDANPRARRQIALDRAAMLAGCGHTRHAIRVLRRSGDLLTPMSPAEITAAAWQLTAAEFVHKTTAEKRAWPQPGEHRHQFWCQQLADARLPLCRTATHTDSDELVDVLTAAFTDSALAARFGPVTAHHRERWRARLRTLTTSHLPGRHIRLAVDGDAIIGALIWTTCPDSDQPTPSPDHLLLAQHDDAHRSRLLHQQLTGQHPNSRHHHLLALGVHPRLHHHGAGRQLLLDWQQHLAADPAPHLLYLPTTVAGLARGIGYQPIAPPLTLTLAAPSLQLFARPVKRQRTATTKQADPKAATRTHPPPRAVRRPPALTPKETPFMSAVRGKKRLTKAEYNKTIREAKRLYLQEELSIREVAARLNAPYSTTHGWLVAAGVRLERGRRSPYTNPT